MFITPYFGGCKYTNNFLFINNNIEFQQFVLLITSHLSVIFRLNSEQFSYICSVSYISREMWRKNSEKEREMKMI